MASKGVASRTSFRASVPRPSRCSSTAMADTTPTLSRTSNIPTRTAGRTRLQLSNGIPHFSMRNLGTMSPSTNHSSSPTRPLTQRNWSTYRSTTVQRPSRTRLPRRLSSSLRTIRKVQSQTSFWLRLRLRPGLGTLFGRVFAGLVSATPEWLGSRFESWTEPVLGNILEQPDRALRSPVASSEFDLLMHAVAPTSGRL